MPHKFGDTVVLVLKSRDKDTGDDVFTRVNATVLHSVTQPDGAEKLSAHEVYTQRLLKGHNGKPLPGGEYLDLAYPNLGLVPAGQSMLTTRDPSLIFKNAHTVAEWEEDSVIGWVPAPNETNILDLVDALERSRATTQKLAAENETLRGKPSGADLDADAADKAAKDATGGADDQKAKDATNGKVRQIKGK